MSKFIKEFITTATGTEGSLLIVKTIADQLMPDVTATTIDRKYAAMVFGPNDIKGSSIDVDYEDENGMTVYAIAEGGSIPMGVQTYSSVNVKPLKYGVRPLITKEMIEDGLFNLIQSNVKSAIRKLQEKESSLVVTQLDTAANTISGGAAVTVANITRAMQYLRDYDYKPGVMFIGPEVENDLRQIDTFTEVDKSGDNSMLRQGVIGKLFGMDVVVVSQGGQGGYTSTTSYVIDPAHAFVVAEKRPITISEYDDRVNDLTGVVITQRIAAKAIRTYAICKITSS